MNVMTTRSIRVTRYAGLSTFMGTFLVLTLLMANPGAAQTDDDAPYVVGAREVFLPELSSENGDGSLCAREIVIQNVGDQPTKGLFLFWGPSRECFVDDSWAIIDVECSGLLRPGGAWRITGHAIHDDAKSATVFSATTKTFSEAGIEMGLGIEEEVADYLCKTLFFSVSGSISDEGRFRSAFRTGDTFSDLPMDRVVGAPLSASVIRRCADGATRYSGIPGGDDISGGTAGRSFEYVSPFVAAGPARASGSQLLTMNVGLQCATVQVFARPHSTVPAIPGEDVTCSTGTACAELSIPPGGSTAFDPNSTGCLDTDGSVWLRSDQPLAVVVDSSGDAGRMSTTAGPRLWSGAGVDPTRLEDETDVLSAPLVYLNYRGWYSTVHVANTSLEDTTARIVVRDESGGELGMFEFSLCPLGSRSIRLQADMTGLPDDTVGSLSIEPIGRDPAEAGANVLSATIEFVRRNEAGVTVSAGSYEVLPETPGAGVIGIPRLEKPIAEGTVSRLAILNRNRDPDFTDLSLSLFDEDGVLDYVCYKLGPTEMKYIDFDRFGYVNPGFTGSAIISAMYWRHSTVDGDLGIAGYPSLAVVALDAPAEVFEDVLIDGVPFGPAYVEMLAPSDLPFTLDQYGGWIPCSPRGRPVIRTWELYVPIATRRW